MRSAGSIRAFLEAGQAARQVLNPDCNGFCREGVRVQQAG